MFVLARPRGWGCRDTRAAAASACSLPTGAAACHNVLYKHPVVCEGCTALATGCAPAAGAPTSLACVKQSNPLRECYLYRNPR